MKKIDITPDVADVLERSTIEGTLLKLPAGQLDRALYASVDKVLKALGGRWERRAGGHVFPRGFELSDVLAAGHVVDRKKSLEIFETPINLAERMAGIAARVSDAIERNIRVLEPSAGTGRLLAAFYENLDTTGQDIVVAVEIDAANCQHLREQGIADEVHCADFLGIVHSLDHFDVVLMNPPFSRNQDIQHVNAALSLLAPGGVLVAITSPHWQFANDQPSRDFRALMAELDAEVEENPAGTFAAEGTKVRTLLVTVRRAR